MRQVQVNCSLSSLLSKGEFGIFQKQIKDSIQSFQPGEWAIIKDDKEQRLGFINPFVNNTRPSIWIMGPVSLLVKDEVTTISILLEKSLKRRSIFFNLMDDNFRAVYGAEDQLPGLVVDCYKNTVLIDIHSAGLDRHRIFIQDWFKAKYPRRAICLFPNLVLREHEGLPHLAKDLLPPILEVAEDKFLLEIPEKNIQKLGYYFDHRTNRQRLRALIQKTKIEHKEGLDLFCYMGTWGHYLLDAGCERVTFIDQGDLVTTITHNLALNGFSGKGDVLRGDVFAQLDKFILEKKRFNVIVSDPPAFAKGLESKSSALAGYRKLHGKILKTLAENGILFIGSCTQCVGLAELEQTVIEAARHEGRTIQLVDMGVQGPDHPCSGNNSKSNYLKGLYYLVE